MWDLLNISWSRLSNLFSAYFQPQIAIQQATQQSATVARLFQQTLLTTVQQHPAICLVTGACIVGAGLYYAFHKPNVPPSGMGLLNQAINACKAKAPNRKQVIARAKKLIDNLDVKELNQADNTGSTPLYCSLLSCREITTHIIEKLLSHNVAANTIMPNGHSVFSDDKLTHHLLSALNGRYNSYACTDARRFPGNIHPEANRDEILSRKGDANQLRAGVEANMIQAYNGEYTREAIARCAMLVDKSKMGACTTFALAIADKLLKLFPEQRIEIVAHDGGYRGTHVYVAMNREGKDWKLNDLKQKKLDEALSADAKRRAVDDAMKEFDHNFIIDPWLASLGWKDGIFTTPQYMKKNGNFLFDVKVLFDSDKLKAKPSARMMS